MRPGATVLQNLMSRGDQVDMCRRHTSCIKLKVKYYTEVKGSQKSQNCFMILVARVPKGKKTQYDCTTRLVKRRSPTKKSHNSIVAWCGKDFEERLSLRYPTCLKSDVRQAASLLRSKNVPPPAPPSTHAPSWRFQLRLVIVER